WHALALHLAEQRVRLVLASRNQERLAALAASIHPRGGGAHVVPTDVADAAPRGHPIDAALAAPGGVDILIQHTRRGAPVALSLRERGAITAHLRGEFLRLRGTDAPGFAAFAPGPQSDDRQYQLDSRQTGDSGLRGVLRQQIRPPGLVGRLTRRAGLAWHSR